MSLAFREAREADLDRLVEIHQSAFPDARGVEARARNFAHNPLGPLRDLVVAESRAGIVAHGFLFALEAWFGGRRVKVGGVSSLGVAPEARGLGIGRALLGELHARARERQQAITLLYPFRQAFYRPDGYAAVSPYRSLELCPDAIPGAWRDRRGGVLRAATGGDRDALVRVHEREGARQTGLVARPPALWEMQLLDERRRWFVVERDERVTGYLAWTLTQPGPQAPITLRIDDVGACDDADRRLLLALAGEQRDQIDAIELEVADDDPLPRALVDPDRNRPGSVRAAHPLGAVLSGPIVRVIDPSRAIEARGYSCEGGLDLELPDDTVHVEVSAGRALVLPSRGGGRLRLDLSVLGAVLYGALTPSAGSRLGWITADSPATLALADALFALPAFFTRDTF